MANLYLKQHQPHLSRQLLSALFLVVGLLISIAFIGLPKGFSETPSPSDNQSDASDLLSVTMSHSKMIYSRREGLQMILTFRAKSSVDLCLRENPLSQIDLTVSRAGAAPLELSPVVSQMIPMTWKSQNRLRHLAPAETWTARLNLRQLQFKNGETWQPGEYTVDGAFLLCEQGQPPSRFGVDLGEETPIEFEQPVYFMIAN